MKQNLLEHRNGTLELERRLDGHEQKVFSAKSEFCHYKIEKEEEIRTHYLEINWMKSTLAKARERLTKYEGEKEERLDRVNLKEMHLG